MRHSYPIEFQCQWDGLCNLGNHIFEMFQTQCKRNAMHCKNITCITKTLYDNMIATLCAHAKSREEKESPQEEGTGMRLWKMAEKKKKSMIKKNKFAFFIFQTQMDGTKYFSCCYSTNK